MKHLTILIAALIALGPALAAPAHDPLLDPMLMNPMEIIDELDEAEARDFAERAGLAPAHQNWLERLLKPRYSPAAPPAADHT